MNAARDTLFPARMRCALDVAGAGAPFASVADYEIGLRRLEGFAGYLD